MFIENLQKTTPTAILNINLRKTESKSVLFTIFTILGTNIKGAGAWAIRETEKVFAASNGKYKKAMRIAICCSLLFVFYVAAGRSSCTKSRASCNRCKSGRAAKIPLHRDLTLRVPLLLLVVAGHLPPAETTMTTPTGATAKWR